MHTPINKYKLNKKGREVYDKVESYIKNIKHPIFFRAKIGTVELDSKEFDLLLEGMSSTERHYYKHEIPNFMGVKIVRIK